MRKALATVKSSVRIGRVVPQFHVASAVRCNRCGATLYANEGNVEPEQALGVLVATADTWREYGQAGHSCN